MTSLCTANFTNSTCNKRNESSTLNENVEEQHLCSNFSSDAWIDNRKLPADRPGSSWLVSVLHCQQYQITKITKSQFLRRTGCTSVAGLFSSVFVWSYALALVGLSCWFNEKCWHLMFTLQLLKELVPATNAFPIRADMASSVCCFNSLRPRGIKANDTESIPRLPLKGHIAVSGWRDVTDGDHFDSLETGDVQVGLISHNFGHHWASIFT